MVDGQTVTNHQLLGAPVWRDDGRALAWLERTASGPRVVVLPDVDQPAEQMPFAAPAKGERLFWTGGRRVALGSTPLAPLAVISWTETEPDAAPGWLRVLPAAFTTTVDLRQK